jgi:hypothetical protein
MNELILEGILTTTNEDGTPHVAVMGAAVDPTGGVWFERMVLRPFGNTRTLMNLQRTDQAVFHVTDDARLLAQAAIGRLDPLPELVPTKAVRGWSLVDCCRWYALRVAKIEPPVPRADIEAEVVDREQIREFLGFNRAKHAIVEAAILATRAHFVSREALQAELARLAKPIQKTGGALEREALELLERYVQEATKGTS